MGNSPIVFTTRIPYFSQGLSSVRALASADSLSHNLLGTFLVTFALFGAPYWQLLLFEANSEILGQLKRKFGGTCG